MCYNISSLFLSTTTLAKEKEVQSTTSTSSENTFEGIDADRALRDLAVCIAEVSAFVFVSTVAVVVAFVLVAATVEAAYQGKIPAVVAWIIGLATVGAFLKLIHIAFQKRAEERSRAH
jgi:hypothetical protein